MTECAPTREEIREDTRVCCASARTGCVDGVDGAHHPLGAVDGVDPVRKHPSVKEGSARRRPDKVRTKVIDEGGEVVLHHVRGHVWSHV